MKFIGKFDQKYTEQNMIDGKMQFYNVYSL